MRGVMFSNFAAKKFDSQKVDHGPTLSLRLFIRFARKNSPSGNHDSYFSPFVIKSLQDNGEVELV